MDPALMCTALREVDTHRGQKALSMLTLDFHKGTLLQGSICSASVDVVPFRIQEERLES